VAHGGRVDKHIGDCVMAVFGAPIAYGNDAERAALSALAIRSALAARDSASGRPVDVHIGVAAGEVVASGTGSEAYREYTVTGETVNLAARLTDRAPAGEILISEMVWRALGSKFDGAEAGVLDVKGFAAPVRAYRLFGLGGVSAENLRPIVGRVRELSLLRAGAATCLQTGRGGAFLITGEAGIGKTRLVQEMAREASAAGFASASGSVVDFGATIDAVGLLVRSALRVGPEASVEGREGAVALAIEDGLIDPEDAVFLYDLLDLSQPKSLRGFYDAMDNAARREGRKRLLTRLLATLASRQPRLLIVEDVQWADDSTRDDLATLAAAAGERPALLVMTARNHQGQPAWRAGLALTTIELGPLGQDDALAMARALTGAEARVEQMVDRAAGNPLFLEQLVRHAEANDDVAVPGTVQALVQARVDRLDAQDRLALQAASVLGQNFPLAALRHLIAEEEYDGANLVSGALLTRAGDYCAFAHALIRDAVYASLLRARRRELHRSAAEWHASRDASLRAEHLDRADDAGAPLAYAAAAEAQARLLRFERALQLAERGRALAASNDEVIELSLLGAVFLRELARAQESLEAFRRVVAAAATDDLAKSRALIGVASSARLTGGAEEGFQALAAAKPLAERSEAQPELSDIHYYLGALLFSAGDAPGCERHHDQSLSFALKAQDAEREARALSGMGDAHYGRGRMRLAIDCFRRCRALCPELGFGRIEVGCTHMIGGMRRYLFEWEQAVDDLRQAIEMAGKVSAFRTQMVAFNILGEMEVDDGRPDAAKETLAKALRLAEAFDNPRHRGYLLYQMSKAYLCEPDGKREAARLLDEALALCRKTDIRFIGPRVLAAVALVDDRRRSEALSEGAAIIADGCLAHNVLWYYRDAMEAHLRARDLDRVRICASALGQFTAQDPLPWSDYFIERARALADHAEGRRDPRLYETLARLTRQAQASGLSASIPAMEEALAGGAT
jgi:tetratricopeptide (TPR) repeat protein